MTLCSTCLSRNRRLISIQTLKDILISLKWMSIDPLKNLNSNSTLTICKKISYDAVYCDDVNEELEDYETYDNDEQNITVLETKVDKNYLDQCDMEDVIPDLFVTSTGEDVGVSKKDMMYENNNLKLETETSDDVKEELDDYVTYDNDEQNITVLETEVDNNYLDQCDMEHVIPDLFVTSTGEDVGKSKKDMMYENNNLKLETETSDSEDDNYLEVKKKSSNVNKEKVKKNQNNLKSTVEDVKLREHQTKVDTNFIMKKLTMDEMLKKRDLDKNVDRFQKSPFKCFKCILGFVDEQKYNNHISDKHCKADNKYLCSICETWFYSIYLMRIHYEQHFNSYQCKLCPYTHNLLSGIRAHCNKEHAEKMRDKKYSCELCGKNFETRNKYNSHKLSHRGKKTCPHCNRVLSAANFKEHLLIHTGKPMVECHICHKEYRGTWGLKVHMRTHNDTKDEAAYCVECNIQFKSVYSYRAHLKYTAKHIKEEDKKYKCPLCTKRFNNDFWLKSHMESMHNDKHNYTCDTCKQTFKTRIRLRVHIREKHDTKPKPRDKICSICSKAFIEKKVLLQHMNAHMGARPYECDVCSANFSYSGALYTHKKIRHKMQKKKMTQKTTE